MLRPLTLHTEAFWVSPWDCTVYVGLREKGLEFSTTIVTLREGMGIVSPVQEYTVTGSAPATRPSLRPIWEQCSGT